MLSEGWDVKNVFLIVPHEERAFNSKLLIAQVLGRGLRIPEGWKGEQPIVTVFNHDAWSGRIRHLVNEILEIERRLSSAIVPTSPYHFDIHNLNYDRDEDTSEFTKKGEYRLLEGGFVDFPTQVEAEDVTIDFERAVSGEHTKFKTRIEHKTYSIEEVAELMFGRLQSIDEESKDADDPNDRTNYIKKFPLERLEQIVRESLKRAKVKSGQITGANRQKFLQALGTLKRKKSKKVVYKLNPKALNTLNTKERHAESCSAAELRRADKTIFFGPDCEASIPDEQLEFFKEILDPDGDFRGGRELIVNSHDFKIPLNMAIADAKPERKFVRMLCERENAQVIDAWIKNTPQRFYKIDYAWKKGNTPKRGEFSPDFFIKKGDMIFVVEIKGDEEISDPSPENIKKNEYTIAHFKRLNEWLEKEKNPIRYQFNFLTPKDYNRFFQQMRNNELLGFRSEIDVVLINSIANGK
jgi:type III restriction enzyme